MKTPHTHYRRGTHLFIIMRDGTRFEDIFVDHKSGYVQLRKRGYVKLDKVRSMSFRRLSAKTSKR